MPSAVKDLTALDSTLELKCDSTIGLDGHGSSTATSQYLSGAGTIQIEATTQVTDPAVWIIPPQKSVNPVAASPAQAAVGVVLADIGGFARVRLRKTVGAASLVAGLGVE